MWNIHAMTSDSDRNIHYLQKKMDGITDLHRKDPKLDTEEQKLHVSLVWSQSFTHPPHVTWNKKGDLFGDEKERDRMWEKEKKGGGCAHGQGTMAEFIKIIITKPITFHDNSTPVKKKLKQNNYGY